MSRLYPHMMMGALLALAIMGMASFAGKIEGAAFPVVRNVQIISTERASTSWTRFWGSFDKVRDCDFVRLQWMLLIGEKTTPVDFRFDEGPRLRGPGNTDFGPWLVQMTAEQLTQRGEAVVIHSCHPLWDTETKFYTGQPTD